MERLLDALVVRERRKQQIPGRDRFKASTFDGVADVEYFRRQFMELKRVKRPCSKATFESRTEEENHRLW